MAVALARSRAEATPSRTQAAAAVPVVQRTSRDSRRYGLSGRSIQPALRISAAHDPAEREAESVAARVARGGIGHAAPGLQRSPLLVQRQSPGAAGGVASPVVEARVRAAATGGSPLVPALRQTLEPRFRADFGGVRLHTDAKAAALATAIGARAFTFGNHIFFNAGQYQPQTPEGLELLAHELTHTIQQQAVIQRAVNDAPVIGERTAPQASRLGMSDALNYFADAANAIPGYRMFTILIGVNPINMNAVEASAANILRALVEFLPGGVVITRVLDSYGIFDRVGGWIEGQLKSLGITGAAIRAAVNAFMDGLSWRDIFALGSLWDRAKSIFTTPITRIIAFAKSLFGEILRFVREAVLRPLAALAEGTAGYGLLKAVIGFDPVTGEAVPRTAETIIGGFMTMIGQQELWENIKRANAIPRAWAWFQGALGGLMGLVRSIPERFMAALRGLEIMDFVVLPSAFVKLAKVFGGFLVDFGSWALGTVLNLLQIVVEVLAPGVMPYLRKAAGAFNTIIANPVRFVQTLVRAAVQGFKQFASRFLTHLQASLIGWLTGALGGAGLYLPKSLAPMELVKFVLSVLGLTWANIRGKLVAATSETVVTALETGFDIVRTLVTEGPAAAWQKIVETLTNLKQMAIDAIMDFVKSKVVEAAITKLLSLLSPAGALIQAIIATYNTIMFFVERIRQIAQVAAAFIDGIAAIAAGNIAPAADRVEQTMAGLLTLVISFLARIAGLGKVGDAVTGLIAKIRAPIDKALDKVVAWIVAQARKLGKMISQGAKNLWQKVFRKRPFSCGGEAHNSWVDESGEVMVASELMPLKARFERWQGNLSSVDEKDRPEAKKLLGSANGMRVTINRKSMEVVKAQRANDEPTINKVQPEIETVYAQLLPTLARLFTLFKETKTARGAKIDIDFASIFNRYDTEILPLKRGRPVLVTGSAKTIYSQVAATWNAAQAKIADGDNPGYLMRMAQGTKFQMERVLAAAKNIGTSKFPQLTGVEVTVPPKTIAKDILTGTRVDYVVKDKALIKVELVAIEVKKFGRQQEDDSVTAQVSKLRRQVTKYLNSVTPSYDVVRLEIGGFKKLKKDFRDELTNLEAQMNTIAAASKKRVELVGL